MVLAFLIYLRVVKFITDGDTDSSFDIPIFIRRLDILQYPLNHRMLRRPLLNNGVAFDTAIVGLSGFLLGPIDHRKDFLSIEWLIFLEDDFLDLTLGEFRYVIAPEPIANIEEFLGVGECERVRNRHLFVGAEGHDRECYRGHGHNYQATRARSRTVP